MSDKHHVRNQAIKMAFENPHLREKMIPLIQKLSGEFTEQEWKTHKQNHPNADPKDHTISKGDKSEGKSSGKPLSKLDLSDRTKKRVKGLVEKLTPIIHDPEDEYGDKDFKEEVYDLIKKNSPMFSHSNQDIKDAVDALLSEVKKNKPKSDSKKPRENGELPIGDKGQQKKKREEMSKAELVKAYEEAIKKSNMSPEDKKKALEKAKKPNFDPEAALGAMGDDEEEDGGKTAKTKKDTTMNTLRAQVIRLAHENPELRKDLLPLLQQAKVAGRPIDHRTFDSLKKGDRVMVESGGGWSSGKHLLEVGRMSYSKKYDVYTKKLYYIDENTNLPMTKGRVKWNLFKRMSWRGEVYDPPQVDLAQGDMAVSVKSFAKVASKTASMPPANKRPAGEKARRKWYEWLTTDIQTKLEEAGVPQKIIDNAIKSICNYNYGILYDKDFYGSNKYYFFVTNADIHAWVTGRAKLSDVSPYYQGSGEKHKESYLMFLKYYIAKYGSANNDVLRDKAMAMMNKCKGYQVALAAHTSGAGDYNSSFRYDVLKNPSDRAKDLTEMIENASADNLKKIISALEWASKCPEPPKNLY